MLCVYHIVLIAHIQGTIQLACLHKIQGEADVAQRVLCKTFPFECSTTSAGRYCSAQPGITEQPNVTVRIRAYTATRELDITDVLPERRDAFTLGTRVLLTCDVTERPEGNEVLSYKWYHNCTGHPDSRCEIRDGDPTTE